MTDLQIRIAKTIAEPPANEPIGKGRKPQRKAVEGQAAHSEWILCPVCFSANEVVVGRNTWCCMNYCWNCGTILEVE
jgi:hypothetical protein